VFNNWKADELFATVALRLQQGEGSVHQTSKREGFSQDQPQKNRAREKQTDK